MIKIEAIAWYGKYDIQSYAYEVKDGYGLG